jgi:hypothetical protein
MQLCNNKTVYGEKIGLDDGSNLLIGLLRHSLDCATALGVGMGSLDSTRVCMLGSESDPVKPRQDWRGSQVPGLASSGIVIGRTKCNRTSPGLSQRVNICAASGLIVLAYTPMFP